MEVVPAADAMRRIAASSIPTSTRYGELVLSFSNDDESFCRSSSWTREALESLLRAWTKRSSFVFQHALSDVGIGVRAWKKTRLGIW